MPNQLKIASYLWIFLVFIFSNCTENKAPVSQTTGTKSDAQATNAPRQKKKKPQKHQHAQTNAALEPLWTYQFDSLKQNFKPTQLKTIQSDTLSPQWIAKIMNQNWEKVQIQFVRVSNDTVYIKIPDSQALTQQMGSAGAREFMVAATYSFTEIKKIRYVAYDFEVGDHMNPGVYSRASWEKE